MRFLILVIAVLACAVPAAAKGPFDGKWIADLRVQDASGLVDDYLVADGAYACRSCDPPRAYAIDGKLHSITGDPEIASESVTVLGPHAILTREISPVRVREVTMTVSSDDKTATYVAIDRRTDIPGRLRTEYLAERIAPGPAGAHPVSGKWRGVRYVSVPAPYREKDIRQDGERLTVFSPRGGAYAATLDGPFEQVGAGHIWVAFKQTDPRTLSETMKNGDKVIQTRTYTLAADGKSLDIATIDMVTGVTYRSTSRRQ
jgi:hypothetical protein